MKNPSSKMTKVKKREIIKGYLNSLKPLFSQSGDTLTLTLMDNDDNVGEASFLIQMRKGTLKPITQRVIQMTNVDTMKVIENISHLVPLKEGDMKLVRIEILEYLKSVVGNHFD